MFKMETAVSSPFVQNEDKKLSKKPGRKKKPLGLSLDEMESASKSAVTCYSKPNHGQNLAEQLNKLRMQDVLCDVVLIAEGRRIRAHRIILISCSGYFTAMFTSDMIEAHSNEVEIIDMDAQTLESLVDFLYTGELDINEGNVQNILPAASLLQLFEIQTACCEYLREQLDPTNCLGIRSLADTHSCRELVASADDYTLKNFARVIRSEEFLLLPVEPLTEIIANDKLNVNSEELVFEAVIQWVRHDVATRKMYLSKLLKHVRLHLCSPKFLVCKVSEELLVKTDAASRDLVEEAKNYLLLSTQQPNMQGTRTRPRKSFTGQVLYAIDGWCNDDGVSMEMLDPSRSPSVWTCVASMSKIRFGVGVAALGDLLYAIGGHDGRSFLNSIERYDPVTNQWSNDVAPMAKCRGYTGVAALNGFLYAVGGHDGNGCLDVVERYDAQRNEWTKVDCMGTGRNCVSVSVLDGCLYAVGGSNGRATLNTVERYDPRVGSWEEVRPMLTKRMNLGTSVYDGHIYAVGGKGDTLTALNTVEKYNAAMNEWSPVVPMNIRRGEVRVAVVNERLYAVGGFDGERCLSSVEVFDPDCQEWRIHSHMNYTRYGGGVAVVKKSPT